MNIVIYFSANRNKPTFKCGLIRVTLAQIKAIKCFQRNKQLIRCLIYFIESKVFMIFDVAKKQNNNKSRCIHEHLSNSHYYFHCRFNLHIQFNV